MLKDSLKIKSLGLSMFLNHIPHKIANNLVGNTQRVPLLGHTVLKEKSQQMGTVPCVDNSWKDLLKPALISRLAGFLVKNIFMLA